MEYFGVALVIINILLLFAHPWIQSYTTRLMDKKFLHLDVSGLQKKIFIREILSYVVILVMVGMIMVASGEAGRSLEAGKIMSRIWMIIPTYAILTFSYLYRVSKNNSFLKVLAGTAIKTIIGIGVTYWIWWALIAARSL